MGERYVHAGKVRSRFSRLRLPGRRLDHDVGRGRRLIRARSGTRSPRRLRSPGSPRRSFHPSPSRRSSRRDGGRQPRPGGDPAQARLTTPPLRRDRSRPYGGRGLMACGPEPGVCGLVGRWRPRGGRGADMLWGPGACRPPAPGPELPGRGRPPGGGAGAPAAGGQVRRARERAGRPRGAARPPAAGLPGVGVVLCLYWWQSRCGRKVWQVTLLCEVSGSRPVVLS